MDEEEIRSRKDLVLPSPQAPSSVSAIEHSEEPSRDDPQLEKVTTSAPPKTRVTWMTFLQRELEFLGVTQIMIALICLCFGTIICSIINVSEVTGDIFSSFKAGYPFWGAALFAVSGIVSLMCKKKRAMYLVRGCLGASCVSCVTSGVGIALLTINLRNCYTSLHDCQDAREDDFCFLASFSTEIVAITLCLTVLGFCCSMLLIIYGAGDILKQNKIPEDCLYEEINMYTSIYSELEVRPKTSSPSDS